jgi:hypothetical protein
MLLRGLMFIAEEVRKRADEELNSEDLVHRQMTEAYSLLETGAITEQEFDRREQAFLERLQAIEARKKAQQRQGRGRGRR